MVTEYGMSSKLGPVFLGTEHEVFLGKSFSQQNSGFSEMVNTDIDSEVHALLQEAYDRAEHILVEHMDQLHGLAGILIDREKIDRNEFLRFMEGSAAVKAAEQARAEAPDPAPQDAPRTRVLEPEGESTVSLDKRAEPDG